MKTEPYFLNINQCQIIRFTNQEEGTTCRFWLQFNNQEYLLKVEDLYHCYLEIFCSKIMHYLDIPTVDYRLAFYHDERVIITPNYNPEHFPKISLSEIIKKYLQTKNEIIQSNYYCYENIKEIIKWYFANESESIIQNLYDGLFREFMSSVFLANSDLHDHNIEIYNPEYPTISPCYDYGQCFHIRFDFLNTSPYFFKYATYYKNDLSPDFEKPKETLTKFLEYGEKKHIEEFKTKLEQLQKLNLNIINKEIEEETKIHIPEEIQKRLLKRYSNNIKGISDLVQK